MSIETAALMGMGLIAVWGLIAVLLAMWSASHHGKTHISDTALKH